MSKLDFSRQVVPLGEHVDVHDIIAGFRTSANLPNISDDLLDNSNDNDRPYSPALIGFDETGAANVGETLLSRPNLASNSQSIAKESSYLFDTCSYVTSTASNLSHNSLTYPISNPLRRGYRRAQDVSLAALPTQWHNRPSTVSPSSDEASLSDIQQPLHIFEAKVTEKHHESPCPVVKQLTTLKTLNKHLIRPERNDNSRGEYRQTFSSNQWNDTRRRYVSVDLYSDSYQTIPRPLSASMSLPSTSSGTFERRSSNLRKRDDVQLNIYEQYSKSIENHNKALVYECSYISPEPDCKYAVDCGQFSSFHPNSSSAPSHLSSGMCLKDVIKESHHEKTVLRSIPTPSPYIPSLPKTNLNDIKVEYMPLPREDDHALTSRKVEEVKPRLY